MVVGKRGGGTCSVWAFLSGCSDRRSLNRRIAVAREHFFSSLGFNGRENERTPRSERLSERCHSGLIVRRSKTAGVCLQIIKEAVGGLREPI